MYIIEAVVNKKTIKISSMNTYLSKSDQEALDQILASGEFIPCKTKKFSKETSLGYLTEEEKAIFSLMKKKVREYNTFFEYENTVTLYNAWNYSWDGVGEYESMSRIKEDVIFLGYLLRRHIQCAHELSDLDFDVRKDWEIVNCPLGMRVAEVYPSGN